MKQKQVINTAPLSKGKYLQGKFKPQNPQKYQGDVENITYRSSLEFKYMMDLDRDPNVVSWIAEHPVICYSDPKTKALRRYFPDFDVTRRGKGASLVREIIEIKPESQTKMPTKKENSKKTSKKFIAEALTYVTNQAKWEACQRWCKINDAVFKVVTEQDLKVKK